MDKVREPARETDVFDSADVVVVGGGPAGLAAAVAAARGGADTLLIERYGCLGGLATGGIVCEMDCENDHRGRDIVGGIPRAMLERLDALGAVTFDNEKRQAHPEILKCVADEMTAAAGARLLLHTCAAGVISDGARITHLLAESKAGRRAVEGKVFVDATGDADVAFWAGAPCDYDSKPIGVNLVLANIDREKFIRWERANREEYMRFHNDLAAQGGMSLSTMASPVGGAGWVNVRGPASVASAGDAQTPISGLDPSHLTYVETEIRRRILKSLPAYRRHVPGYEKAQVVSIASQIGVRETRRIRGEYTLTIDDCRASRQFDDNIGLGGAWDTPGIRYGIPYRSLVPRGCENLLVAGRCAATDHAAQEYTRIILMCMVMGEAAGAAAGIAAASDGAVEWVAVGALQEALRGNGVMLE